MFIKSAICLCKLFLMDFCKQCESMIQLRSHKPVEKLKSAPNSNNTNKCVWIFSLAFNGDRKSAPLLLSTQQFHAEGKLTFFKQHLDLKQHGHNSLFNKRRWQAANVFLNVRLIADWCLVLSWVCAESGGTDCNSVGAINIISNMTQRFTKLERPAAVRDRKGRASNSEHKQRNYSEEEKHNSVLDDGC